MLNALINLNGLKTGLLVTRGFEDVIENDGIENKQYTVAIDIHVNGDELVADYSPDERTALFAGTATSASAAARTRLASGPASATAARRPRPGIRSQST